MIAILFLVVVLASADAQTCNVLVSREVVRSDRNDIVPPANASDPVIFTCTALTGDRRGYAAATAYIAGFLMNYRCKVPDGWELSEGLGQTSDEEATLYIADVQDGVCSDCVRKPSGDTGEPDGHCQPCTSGCATCSIIGCFTCSDGYSLSNTTCVRAEPPPGLTTEILAIIIVCSVLGVVFIALAGAAVALIVYILTFTRTETIAHRRLRTENQPVTYRRRHDIGTHRHNPMFGAAEGWSNPTFTDSPEGGWSKSLAPRRPPLQSMQIADSKDDAGEIDDKQVEKVTVQEGTVEYDEYEDY